MLSSLRAASKLSPLARRSLSSASLLRASPLLAASSARTSAFKVASSAPTTVRMSSHGTGESTVRPRMARAPLTRPQVRPEADKVLQDIADYVSSYKVRNRPPSSPLTLVPDHLRRCVQHRPSLLDRFVRRVPLPR